MNDPASPSTSVPAGSRGLFFRFCAAVFLLLLLNSAYLHLFDSASLFYLANIGYHVVAGCCLGAVALVGAGRYLPAALRRLDGPAASWLRLLALAWIVGGATGAALMVTGATRPMRPLLYTHISACVLGLCATGLYLRTLFLAREQARQAPEAALWRRTRAAWQLGSLLLPAVLALGVVQTRADDPVDNPTWAPVTMEDENPDKRLLPSSIEIKGAEWMPDDFFTETASRSCGEAGCHPDIFKQWYESAHHFSSFNNQWYRKSIEYMQEVHQAQAVADGLGPQAGLRSSQWCAGCHDPSVLLTGRWQQASIKDQLSEAKREINSDPKKLERLHSGLGCLTCHAAVHVKGTMGQGGLVLEYPPLHKYAENPNPAIKKIHNYLISLDPGPHRKLFLKPFHRNSTPEFCSSCHKVHLDVPVNQYRWIRGFNDYDAWQMSGVSGQGARSFYYPKEFKKCASCHMPLVASRDKGNIEGKVHSHRFPAANTAVPTANRHAEQLQETMKFLKDKVLTVDIFALRRGGAVKAAEDFRPQEATAPVAASLMGEGVQHGVGLVLDNSRLTAPLGIAPAALHRGESVGIDVVVRTRGMGHAFPGGTIDAFDTWVELKAEDEKGRVLMWSGDVAEGGKGPVDPSAHFYRALLVDERGNPINKRNAFAARALVYANVIPPGAADTVHYRLQVPKDCGSRVTLTAKVNYRKFSHYYNQFAYGGIRDPAKKQVFNAHFDSGFFRFDGDTSDVSGEIKAIPEIPIVVMAENKLTLPVAGGNPGAPAMLTPKESWERWNDYGIGLLRQRDFRGAAAAFRNVLKARPDYGDGFVHLGQTLLDDGQVAEAARELEKAVAMAKTREQQGKAFFHYGRALRESGRLREAVQRLQDCLTLFPRDRVVASELGQTLVNLGDYAAAERAYRQTLEVDPEDLTANYSLIKVYKGLEAKTANELRALQDGRLDAADEARVASMNRRIAEYRGSRQRAEQLYRRFVADETAGERTAILKRVSPHDNNEAQAVHEHR